MFISLMIQFFYNTPSNPVLIQIEKTFLFEVSNIHLFFIFNYWNIIFKNKCLNFFG
jgi:hypothetical protein